MHPPTTPVSNVCRPHPVWGPQLYICGAYIYAECGWWVFMCHVHHVYVAKNLRKIKYETLNQNQLFVL